MHSLVLFNVINIIYTLWGDNCGGNCVVLKTESSIHAAVVNCMLINAIKIQFKLHQITFVNIMFVLNM